MAIRDRLTDGQIAFTRAELKIVRQLLSNYPAAGLNTVAHLAAAAGVSNPTVVRFTSKLGYEGYPEFQAALLGEVQERMSSPLSMLDTRKPSLEQENFYQYFLRASIHALESSMQMLPPHDFEAAVEAGADLSMRVHCLGGRFSGFLAGGVIGAWLFQRFGYDALLAPALLTGCTGATYIVYRLSRRLYTAP